MLNNNIFSFRNSYNAYNNNFNTLMLAINEGINLLRNSSPSNPISEDVVIIWQKYVFSILNIISTSYNQNIILEYNSFLLTMNAPTPQDKLCRSIEKLLDMAKGI